MKPILFILAISTFLSLTASAQDDRKTRVDHTYSTHNYKHPNKAAVARQWENKTQVPVNAPGAGTSALANYKQPVPGARPAGGVVMPHTPETDVAVRNYKDQRVGSSKSTGVSNALAVEPKPAQPNPQTGQ